MIRLTVFTVGWLLMVAASVQALTVEEIIKLKQAGVSDRTIQMLIERDGSPRAAGTWRTHDGWIIHTTEVLETRRNGDLDYRNAYPITVYPEIYLGRRNFRRDRN
jgi:hypothetical protein